MTKLASLFISIFLLVSSGAFAQSALQQLKDATSGNQSTGKTFDNNNHPQQMDAYPKNSGNVVAPSSGTASGYSAPTSSGTASGYSAPVSSGTATTRKTGTETTKK
jgi:hypothetical protein